MGGQGCRLDLGPGDNAFEENTELLRVVKVRSLSLSFCPRKRIVRRFVVEISELLRVVEEVPSGLAAAGICVCAARELFVGLWSRFRSCCGWSRCARA